jgi:DNA invertase Pin-like site-specific DNA recombinase
MRVAGYIRVSTEDQGDSRAGLEAQRSAIELECRRRSWELACIEQDVASGKSTDKRPGLAKALAAVQGDTADGLVVAKLDRLSRSLLDFAAIVEQSRRQGWQLIALDLGVDTTTPSGEMMANVLAVFAQFERRLIGQRTTDALAAKRAAGVTLGRPQSLSSQIVDRIKAERAGGATLAAIAERLTRMVFLPRTGASAGGREPCLRSLNGSCERPGGKVGSSRLEL